jgi:hypothetical protein
MPDIICVAATLGAIESKTRTAAIGAANLVTIE